MIATLPRLRSVFCAACWTKPDLDEAERAREEVAGLVRGEDGDGLADCQDGEDCDGLDNDCDGATDDTPGSTPLEYWLDADGDGFLSDEDCNDQDHRRPRVESST